MTLVEKKRRADEDILAETVIYTIEVEGEAVGELDVVISQNSDNIYLENLDIDEEHRNQGYGTQAIKLVAGMFWRVYIAPTNEDNARLYARLGEDASGSISDSEMEVDQGHGVYVLNRY